MRRRWQTVAICALLITAVWAVFGQTRGFEFVNFDDNEYVYDNPHVSNGLRWQDVRWAFMHSHSSNWHPLTWISHMLDCQFHGLNPGAHHLTSVALHAAVAVLLFLVLREMTGARWRSAFVAAMFAIHPLRVESVAWVAERKDVLSGFFFMLTLGAYTRYARGPSLRRYLLVTVLFAFGLMAKPSLVTLPCLLLLLDYWPLGRFQQGQTTATTLWRLFMEKLPLMVLAAASCVVTTLVQEKAIGRFDALPLGLRLANAGVSYAVYIGQMFWPARLAVFYPYPLRGLPVWEVAGALVLLLALTVAVWRLREHRYLPVGWLWYLGTLVPMVGVVQVGSQAHADRYTYLSQIGCYIALTWGAVELANRSLSQQAALKSCALAALTACMVTAHAQARFWHDSERLWTHNESVTAENATTENNLGMAMMERGRTEEAIVRFRMVTERHPVFAGARYNMGVALAEKGRFDEAIGYYRKALEINPRMANAHHNLAMALVEKGQLEDAVAHYRKALEIDPAMVDAHNSLGVALSKQGQVEAALAEWRKALELNPRYAKAHHNLGIAFSEQGRMDDAIGEWLKSVQLDPKFADPHNNLGMALAEKGRMDDAIAHWRKTLEIQPGNGTARFKLASALKDKGETDEAVSHYRKGLESAPDDVKAHFKLGQALTRNGRAQEAVQHYRKALALQPASAMILNELAWTLATAPDGAARNGPEALEVGQKAVKLSGENNPAILDTLAAAQAECGRFSEAVKTVEQALSLANAQGNASLAAQLADRLTLYKAGKPYRETPVRAGDNESPAQ